VLSDTNMSAPDMCRCVGRGAIILSSVQHSYFGEIRNKIIKSWNTTN